MRNSIKIVGLSLGVASLLYLVGCFGATDADKVEIKPTTKEDGTLGTVQGGQNLKVEGSITTEPEVEKITYTILDKDGNVATKVTVEANTVTGKKSIDLKNDVDLTIKVASDACNGEYTLQIKAEAGTASSTKDLKFTVTNAKNCSQPAGSDITTATIEAGANQNATLGSSIDLDAPAVYKMAEAATRVSDLDICYAYSGTDKVEKLFSPAHAKASGFGFAKDWANPNATKFYKTDLTATQFDNIKTKEEIVALWNESRAITTSEDCAKNDVFIAKTDKGAIVLMLITDQTAGASGKITIKVAK